eukprot:10556951-Alexandrium_andersonii.AAC.1
MSSCLAWPRCTQQEMGTGPAGWVEEQVQGVYIATSQETPCSGWGPQVGGRTSLARSGLGMAGFRQASLFVALQAAARPSLFVQSHAGS